MLTSTPNAAELDIRLFGNLQVLCNRKPVQMRTGSTKQLLLAYLLLHRDTRLTRKKVAHDLWPDERDPLRKLRDAKDRLARSSFGMQCVFADETTVEWRSPDSYYLDLAVFESALHDARSARQHRDLDLLQRSLTVANDCYQDELLAPLEGDWLDRIRTALYRRFRIVLEESIAAFQSVDDLGAAIRFAEALIHLDEFHEESYHILMQLYAQQGMVSALGDTYALLEERLRQELCVEPSAGSRSLYSELTSGQLAVVKHEQPTYPMVTDPIVTASVPIGRDHEWRILNECWQQVEAGHSHCAMILGEAGIGKTHLADTFTAQLAEKAIPVFRAGCYGSDGLNTFGPVYTWMCDPRVVDGVRRLPKVMQSQAARFNSDMLIADPPLALPEPVPLPAQKRLLYDSIVAALAQVGEPFVLYLDDMQWIDRETVAWLRYVLQQTAKRHRVLVLGTIRQGELAAVDESHVWTQALRRERNVTWLELQRLNLAQTERLIQSVEAAPTQGEVSDLYAKTEGNPLFVLEYLRSGAMGLDTDRPIPGAIQQVVQERLQFLSEKSTKLAEFAAVLGRDFDYTLLMHGLKADEREVVRCLDELTRRHLVRGYDHT